MKLLDLFCGAGGASVGYHRAGFEVVGVDNRPQLHYPFEFHQADALEFCAQHGQEFDVIHASPPCQRFTRIASLGRARNRTYPEHKDWIASTRNVLVYLGRHYIIENVMGAPLNNPIVLCGASFGLHVYRHRQFESSILLPQLKHVSHNDRTPSAGNGKSPKGFISVCGSGGVRGMTSIQILEYWSFAMGINWMSRDELAQAIPPAYTEFIGKQLIVAIQEA